MRTDHGSLTWLQSFKDSEGQLARWLEKLQQFSFNIVHRQGKSHRNADGLSRLPCSQRGRDEHQAVAPISQVSEEGCNQPEMRKLQQEDLDLAIVLKAKETQTRPDGEVQKSLSLEARRLFQLWEQLLIRDGVLFRQWESPDASRSVYQLVLPKSQRQDVLRDLHKGVMGGHLGETKVLEKLKVGQP